MKLSELSARLDQQQIPHAVIGALALSAHGVVRASDDIDVLVTDLRCLEAATWSDIGPGITVDIRRGDADDPLAGLVRLTPSHGTPIDVVIGRGRWQDEILGRARRSMLFGSQVPVVSPSDFVLLKLYAGGPQDAWDIDQLLDAVPKIESEVASQLVALPGDCRKLWQRILDARSEG